jgi:hypothetical protein
VLPGLKEGVEPRAHRLGQQRLGEADRVEAEPQRLGPDRRARGLALRRGGWV